MLPLLTDKTCLYVAMCVQRQIATTDADIDRADDRLDIVWRSMSQQEHELVRCMEEQLSLLSVANSYRGEIEALWEADNGDARINLYKMDQGMREFEVVVQYEGSSEQVVLKSRYPDGLFTQAGANARITCEWKTCGERGQSIVQSIVRRAQ